MDSHFKAIDVIRITEAAIKKVILDLTPPRLPKIHLQLKRVIQARKMALTVRSRHRVQHDIKRLGNILPEHADEVGIKESVRTRVWVQVESVYVARQVEELFFPYSPYPSERQSEKEGGRLQEHVLCNIRISSHSSNYFLLSNKQTLLERLHLGEECLAIPIRTR